MIRRVTDKEYYELAFVGLCPKIVKTLHLTLHKAAFDVMVTGEKKLEFRTPSKWINSRLFNKDGTKKHYDYIKFTNGYGSDKPYFVCEFKGFDYEYGFFCLQQRT
jgi:hypothetical protein